MSAEITNRVKENRKKFFEAALLRLSQSLENASYHRQDMEVLSVISSHLYIEECLDKYISHYIYDFEGMRKDLGASLTFSVKLSLARSLRQDDSESWLWLVIQKLNNLRNELAHNSSKSRSE
jgi:hypothetical protein